MRSPWDQRLPDGRCNCPVCAFGRARKANDVEMMESCFDALLDDHFENELRLAHLRDVVTLEADSYFGAHRGWRKRLREALHA